MTFPAALTCRFSLKPEAKDKGADQKINTFDNIQEYLILPVPDTL
jgi:hypothetical protein